ncbi:hypothetical protein OY671_008719, partial [Metschnikowia pulcherrima]
FGRKPEGRGFFHAYQPFRQYRPDRFRAVPRHDDVRRIAGPVRPDRGAGSGGVDRAGAAGDRRGHQLHRYGQRLFGRSVRGDPWPGAARSGREADRRGRRHQGHGHDGAGGERGRRLALPPAARDRRQPRPAGHGPCRSLPDPRSGCADPDRGNPARAGGHRTQRPRALYRRQQSGGSADHEGAGHFGTAGHRLVCLAPGLLHRRRPRSGARDRAPAAKRGAGPDGVE